MFFFNINFYIIINRQISIFIIHQLCHALTVIHTFHHTLQTSLVSSSPFRERLGSNRLPEKPRPRFENA